MSFFDRWRRWLEDISADDESRDPEVAALLERARSLKRESEPEGDLWSGIANRIAASEARVEPSPLSPLIGGMRALFPRPVMAAGMAASLVLATVLVTSYTLRGPAIPTTDAEYAALANELRESDGVSAVHADLLSILESRREALPEETFAALEENVRHLDRALAEIHIALIENPQDHGLVFLLAETHRREAELLERMEWWIGTPEEAKS